MLAMRKAALKVLPLLVVLWATLVIVGGAARMASKSEAATQDAVVKTGLGLCAVSVALLASTRARRRIVPPVPIGKLLPKSLAPLQTTVYPKARLKPPSSGPTKLQLLQVSRT